MIPTLKLSLLLCLLLLCNSLTLDPVHKTSFNSKITHHHLFKNSSSSQSFRTPISNFGPKLHNYNPTLRLPNNFKLPKGLVAINAATTPYECRKADWKYLNHSYLAYEGAKHTEEICQSLSEGIRYRLAGGGSIKKEGGRCTLKAIDTNVADESLCANWIIDEYKISQGQCPLGSAVAVFEDVWDYQLKGELKEDELVVARVGYKGIFAVWPTGQSQFIGYDYSDTYPSRHFCITPRTFAIRPTISENEKLCGTGKSLINMLEIVGNEAICEFIPDYSPVRIAGGVVVGKSDNGCFFKHRSDWDFPERTVLCADIDRSLVNLIDHIKN